MANTENQNTTPIPPTDDQGSVTMDTSKTSKKTKFIIAGIIVVVLACAAGAYALVSGNTQETVTDEATQSYALEVGVNADGYDKDTSTPAIAHVVNEDTGTDFYHAYDANEQAYIEVEEPGTYQVSFVSIINADGSINRAAEDTEIETMVVDNSVLEESNDTNASTETTVDNATDEAVSDDQSSVDDTTTEGDTSDSESADNAEGDTTTDTDTDTDSSDDVDLPFDFDRVEADDVTEEELEEIKGQIEDAVENGDDTLTGDTGEDIINTAEDNISANPNVDKDDSDSDNESDDSSNSSTSSSGSSGSSSSSGSSGSSSGSSSSASSSGSSSGSSSSSSSGGSSSSSSSSHTHNWVASTVKTQTGSQVVCSCGATFSNSSQYVAHAKQYDIGTGHDTYSTQPVYTTTTTYKCSGCGATK